MLESRYPIGSGSGSVKVWHAAELAKFKAFDDREDNDHYIQNTKGMFFFYRTTIRPAMLYGTECWAVKHQHVHKMGVAEMRMLRWMCGHTRKDKIRNEDIRGKVGVAEIEGKMRENRLRWFGYVQRRPTDAPIRRCDYGTEVQGRRGRGRPKKTLEETLRKDLEYLDLTKDMTQDRAQWRSKIHIVDPTQ
ncbi:hypothetical protein EV2_008244 [Malus domestica]